MKPYIICHMMASLDGRIDCDMTEKIEGTDEYYMALDQLNTPSNLFGRVTAALHYVDNTFKSKTQTPIGKESAWKSQVANGFSIVVDTKGTLLWPNDVVDGKPLICITSEQATIEYLNNLQTKNISWIATGKNQIDLTRAMDILCREFGVERLSVVGGGHINGGFLAEGLLDEVSMMYAPGIDGRGGMTAAFDGISPDQGPFQLKLQSVQSFDCGTIWMRYLTK